MESIAGLNFEDLEEKCKAYAGVRASPGVVAVVLSSMENGDTELFVTPQIARELAAALEAGAKFAERGSGDA